MRPVIYDIETKELLPDVEGISLVGVYDIVPNTYHFFDDNLKTRFLVEYFNNSGVQLIGYNNNVFDQRVVQDYWGGFTATTQLDMRQIIGEAIEKPNFKGTLKELFEVNNNLDEDCEEICPVTLFKEGRIVELVNYNMQDLRMIHDLYCRAVREDLISVPGENTSTYISIPAR